MTKKMIVKPVDDDIGKTKNIFVYRQTSNINHTFVGNIIVDNSDVVGALPIDAAPTTSSLST